MDWNGKLLKTIMTPSRNTSGMAYGGGNIWMVTRSVPVFQGDRIVAVATTDVRIVPRSTFASFDGSIGGAALRSVA